MVIRWSNRWAVHELGIGMDSSIERLEDENENEELFTEMIYECMYQRE